MNFAPLLYLVLLVAAFFVFIVRPQRRQMAAHRALVVSLVVGDDVITNAGIFGTIVGLDDSVVRLEIAPGVTIRVARAAVARRAPSPDTAPADAAGRPPRPNSRNSACAGTCGCS